MGQPAPRRMSKGSKPLPGSKGEEQRGGKEAHLFLPPDLSLSSVFLSSLMRTHCCSTRTYVVVFPVLIPPPSDNSFVSSPPRLSIGTLTPYFFLFVLGTMECQGCEWSIPRFTLPYKGQVCLNLHDRRPFTLTR